MELGFRLFGLPVRVSLFFLVVAVLIRPAEVRAAPGLMLAWILVMFAGVLFHELGHALSARAFGQEPAILLHGLGGVTYWSPRGEVAAGPRLLISAAGPGVGVALGGALLLVRNAAVPPGTPGYAILSMAVWVNLWWGILNLVPIFPLDGGQVVVSLLDLVGIRNGRRAVHWLSLVLAALLVVVCVVQLEVLGILVGGLMAYSNYLALRPPPPPPGPPEADPAPPSL